MREKQYGCLLGSHNGWASLISLILAVCIAFFLYTAYLNFNKQVRPEMRQIQGALQEADSAQTVDVSSASSVLQTATSRIQAIDERNRQRGDELMKEIGAMQEY